MELPPKKIIEQLRSVTLSDRERATLRNKLIAHIRTAPLRQSIPSPWSRLFYTKRFQAMMLSIIIIFSYGSSATFAAEGTLPGDMLYPLKTRVIEPVTRLVTATSPEAEATFETKLFEKRLEEAETLSSQKELGPQLTQTVRAGIHEQKIKAEKKVREIEHDSAESVTNSLQFMKSATMNTSADTFQGEDRQNSNQGRSGDSEKTLRGLREKHKHILEKLNLNDDLEDRD